jgi:hypothetical protein
MSRRTLGTVVVVVVVGGGAGGCNAILGINEPNVVADGGVAADATSSDSPSAPVEDAGFNDIPDPSFEKGCGELMADGVEVTPVSAGRTDDHACRVCSSGETFYGVDRRMVTGADNVRVGDSFHAGAWFRKDPDHPSAPDIHVEIEVDVDGPSNTLQQEAVGQSLSTLTDSWQHIEGTFTVKVAATEAGTGNLISIDFLSRTGKPGGGDRCFVVDDVLFRRGNN